MSYGTSSDQEMPQEVLPEETVVPHSAEPSSRGLMLVFASVGMFSLATLGYRSQMSGSAVSQLVSKQPEDMPSTGRGTHPLGGDLDDVTEVAPCDLDASDETKALMTSLGLLRYDTKFLLGHQNSNLYGQFFTDTTGKKGYSDVYNGTGAYPAVFGYDWTDVTENGMDLKEHVKFAYSQGAIIAFDWKPSNPEIIDSEGANKVSGTPCANILKGTGKTYDFFTGWLDTIATEVKKFKYNGVKIPVIFRLFHENTGGWYWWGVDDDTCPDEEYKALWNFTQDYLTQTKGVHQFLWEYAPAKPSDKYESAFEQRYPGSDRVDIIAFDRYDDEDSYKSDVLDDCRTVAEFAAEHNKLAAIGETGIFDGIEDVDSSYADWYYDDFGKNFMTDSKGYCNRISYALAWENSNTHSYWVPLPENKLFSGFQKLYESDYAVFADNSEWQTTLKGEGYYS